MVYRVSQIARAVGVHPNTVRLYEQWGLLAPAPRTAKGYRQYSSEHLEQMRLARIALPGPFPGGGEPVYALVKSAARGDFDEAIHHAERYAENVRREYQGSRKAYRALKRWAHRSTERRVVDVGPTLRRREAARQLGVTVDALRGWERNGLVRVGRDRNGYCRYQSDALHRVAVIRSLRNAGFSVLAILRMFREYERGNVRGLRRALDRPPAGADIVYVTDRWLSTLHEHTLRARRIRRQLEAMRGARTSAMRP